METAFWNLFVVKSNPKLVSIERKKQLLEAKIKAKQLANQEKVHRAPGEHCSRRGGPCFLEGPFRSAAEVSAVFGHDRWRIMRRFVIEQGAKLRPIDDGLEAQLNCAVLSTIRLDVQDADYVIAMAMLLGESSNFEWMGKTLDLAKAYKQLAVFPGHRDLAVVFFKDKEGKPRYYIPNSLMLGSTAAVYAFKRVSRSLWFLLNCYMHVPCAVDFDDYPMFNPKSLADETDGMVSEFLDLLGWRHDRTGPKGRPSSCSFDVLGMTLNLAELQTSKRVIVQNKVGRVDKICQKVESILLQNLHSDRQRRSR